MKGQPYDGAGIIGGSDSFTIIGTPGIGKSTSIVRAMQLISNGAFDMDDERRFTVVIVLKSNTKMLIQTSKSSFQGSTEISRRYLARKMAG